MIPPPRVIDGPNESTSTQRRGAGLQVVISRRKPRPTQVFDTYWAFATEWQRVFRRRVRGEPGPWTSDPVLLAHRFTNPYRAADRVSQYLIREVAYGGTQAPDEVLLRVVLFKLFNRIATWESLERAAGPITCETFDLARCDAVLSRVLDAGTRIYSAAYIMPAASRSSRRKHRTHLELVRSMLVDKLPDRLAETRSMGAAYDLLLAYPGLGPFLAFQILIDLNYTTLLAFSEMDFVVPGPGARSGLRKCFSDPGDYDDADLIRHSQRPGRGIRSKGTGLSGSLGATTSARRLPEPVLRGRQVRAGRSPTSSGSGKPDPHQAAVSSSR